MKKVLTFSALVLLVGTLALPITQSIKAEAAVTQATLRIYNWSDYIYEPSEEGDPISTIEQFQHYMLNEKQIEVEVVYDTFATNEDMYNIMKLGKSQYDLIAPSDYMIQKMMAEDMLEKFDYDLSTQTYPLIPNYTQYASPYLKHIYDEIEVSEYAVGYMWGTLGVIYNPTVADANGEYTMHEDLKSWSALWDPKYQGKISIKDSMRDAYLIGLIHVHAAEIAALKTRYAYGDPVNFQETAFKAGMTALLNDTSPATVAKVAEALAELKKNIFGLEVDSGKTDMATGKIAMNTNWSGDAVYSLDLAEEEHGVELYYSIPEEGGNIWFDGWVMPKGANKALAAEFINFVSDPAIAAQNMGYIGYTSFIGGQEVLSLVHDWYDAEAGSETATAVDLTYFFNGTLVTDPEDPLTSMVITTDLVGRQFTAQYPSEQEILRCVIMQNFDNETTNRVIEMWADFKATRIAAWMVVVMVISGLALASYFVNKLVKMQTSQRRIRRRAAKAH